MSQEESINTGDTTGNGSLHIFSTQESKDAMVNWTDIQYFTVPEFDSPDEPKSGLKMSIDLIRILDKIRIELGVPLRINSGYRTQAHNAMVGGKECSSHTKGNAVDIACKNSTLRYDLIVLFLKYGINRIGIGNTFIHGDIDKDSPPKVVWLY